jgi:ABC-type nitrate/sulfonate/bicarbonate transport system substrate-binding protein
MTRNGNDNMELAPLTRGQFLGGSARAVGVAVIGGGVLSSFLAACGGSSDKGGSKISTVTFQESWLNNVEFAGVYVAVKKGYFADAGIKVKVLPGGTTVDPRNSVANGAALIGSVAVGTDEVLAVSQGAGIQAIAAQFQKNPGCLMVHADSGIKSVKDLKGKTIGLQNAARQQISGILQHNGLQKGDVKLVTVGYDATPFALKKVDAFTAFAFNEPIALAQKGIKTKCFSFSDIGLPAYGDVLIARTSTINKEPELLAGFIGAVRRGWQYTIDHPDEATQLTLDGFAKDQDPKQQRAQMTVEIPMLQSDATKSHGLLSMDKAVWQQSIDFMSTAKLLTKPVSVDDVMVNDILDRVS